MPKRYKLFCGLIIAVSVAVLGFYGQSYSDDRIKAEGLAQELARQKKLEQEGKEILIEGRVQRGVDYSNKGNYQEAREQFKLALEIDPSHEKARSCLSKTISKLNQASEKHYKRGVSYYNKGKMQPAIEELSQIPEDSPYYIQAQERIKNAHDVLFGGKTYGIESPKIGARQVKDYIKQLNEEEKLVLLRKEAHEKRLMIDVENAYLPPERIKELEELTEETEEEIAERIKEEQQQKLIAKMNENVVPALSLSDADIRDVIRELVKLTGVNIILDERALQEVTDDTPLTVSFTTVTPMPLLDLLDISLKATNLAYKVEPTYIWISDRTTIAKEDLVTKTYRLKYGVRRIREVSLITFGEEEE